MSLCSNQNSDSFCDGSFQLLVQLVNTDSVYKVTDIVISRLATENNCDVQSDKNVVICWARIYWELKKNILGCNQKLDLCPWKAEYKPTALFNMVKPSVFCNYCVCSLMTKF